MYKLSFSLTEFLHQYWQKQPTIIKGGFKDFQDPISPEELAGLTMEEEIDSRFVSNLNNDWIAEHGPFNEEKFEGLNESHWSFIVQAANHWHADAAELVEPFKGMPNWLFDDLMISYSVKDGGVGPHIDQYDVFIIQGMGKRHWRVGAKDVGQYTENHRANALRQIESFDSIIDDILEPGDILYIPPGFPHDGYALEPSMSYSVGFRSPKEQELISNFADYVLAHDIGDIHLHKPEITTQNGFGEITTTDLDSLTGMLKSSLNSKSTIDDFMGCMLSQSRHNLNIVPAEPLWQLDEIADHLHSGFTFEKVSGLRALYHQNDEGTLYINGEVFQISNDEVQLTSALCNHDTLSIQQLKGLDSESVRLIQSLVNKGYWYVKEPLEM
ncbi:ribosomal protein uL16 3-hydroxylase [Vibrio sp. VB16]|uniref:ribosomal protein uL16 3-hydroxylase n=1 Tax=Vibrio sp. VB16 TaxID=2785746 RepID=UPI00189F4072|nr:cupin domain-containing protein [Vibrio sp. VB16]UGA57207.1 cupin domain-containing protein [Vibrio sp. VB16]